MVLKIVKSLIDIYHLVFSSRVATCRFQPTCSQYALDAIAKYGFFKGSYLTLARILCCHPLSKRPLYDPV